MAQPKSMRDLLIEELRDIYHAEKQALRAYPKLMRKVSSDKLKQALQTHAEQTEGQVERLQQAFEALGVAARGKLCHAMEGLVEEAKEVMEQDLSPELMDAALIAAAQKMEHYEIASYGTVHAYANALGETEVAKLLEQTLAEEKQTDELLNKIAIDDVNKKAMKAA
ncbi:YciE/YciF ferroxidase family protein [Arenibaculum pallidiluteum]|uniref:YciE/YciF ferroxidase family protein n=1 Tax=Arenibaculum pallidiluteum TaxID=2812559 RepID=UPI001A971E97|nr:ferritin-like domain-containing protein [Arenibaculum pallidiluteum]